MLYVISLYCIMDMSRCFHVTNHCLWMYCALIDGLRRVDP